MDAELRAAYLSTTYMAGEIRIRIGEDPHVDASSWAFVTAENPRSEPDSAERNAARMRALENDLRGYRTLRGRGEPAAGSTWKAEESFLVLGIDRAAAIALGRKYGQNAIVFGERGRPAELIEC
jgi:hypothetical protein